MNYKLLIRGQTAAYSWDVKKDVALQDLLNKLVCMWPLVNRIALTQQDGADT